MKHTPTVIALSESGAATARRIAVALGAPLHGRQDRVAAEDAHFPDALDHIRDLFAAGIPVVGVCAAGILIRAVAPLLSDKRIEPPVVAVAEDGSAAIPLLGGHHGANRLAREIAEILNGTAQVTTAGDLTLGLSLDEPPPGWGMQIWAGSVKGLAAGLLSGAERQVMGAGPFAEDLARKLGVTLTSHRMDSFPMLGSMQQEDAVLVTCTEGSEVNAISYHPKRYVIGVGCARDCPPQELQALVQEAMAAEQIPKAGVAGIFSIDLKADEPAVLSLAAPESPLRVFPADRLEAEAGRLANPSEIVFAEVGCHGVAEGAALAAAGPEGWLVVEKRKTANATCAIARAPAPLVALPGGRRGRVSLVGIGPGQSAWRTPEASRLVVEADELVGYGLYIDLLGPLAAGKPRHDFPLGGEEARCRFALERAGEGRDVAIICSGDAGIYAMGALVFELMDTGAAGGPVSDAARRVEVISAPGVSALQAAAARAGAPLGHDFCAISLSDLLTPRADILRRIRAAAEGDFVIAFYNPVSKRRRTLLAEARDILLGHRPEDCPVLLASSLGRPEEQIRYRTLATLEVGEVDMLTTVLIGSSQSRLAQLGEGPRMYTPRGYERKVLDE
ncbi:MAG: precorrin-3B C(17)-methyltransferase [Pseudomonadota bacterium]